MSKTSHELSFVSIDGRTLPHSHAELVQTPRGWHVELDDVPPDSCPLVKRSVRSRWRSGTESVMRQPSLPTSSPRRVTCS